MLNRGSSAWIGICVVALGIIGWNGKYIVQPGEVGVVKYLGEAQKDTLSEGFNLKTPLLTSVETVSIRPQTYANTEENRIVAGSRDLQDLLSLVEVQYKINEESVADFYRQYRTIENFEVAVIQGVVLEAYNTAAANFRADEVGTKRSELVEIFRQIVEQKLKAYPVVVMRATVKDINFSPEFAAAVEKRQVAEQKAQEAVFRAQEAEQDAQAEINRAKGDAEAARLRAQALNAKGGELAIQELALRLWAEKGAPMPQVLVTGENGGNIPFLFNLDSIGKKQAAE